MFCFVFSQQHTHKRVVWERAGQGQKKKRSALYPADAHHQSISQSVNHHHHPRAFHQAIPATPQIPRPAAPHAAPTAHTSPIRRKPLA